MKKHSSSHSARIPLKTHKVTKHKAGGKLRAFFSNPRAVLLSVIILVAVISALSSAMGDKGADTASKPPARAPTVDGSSAVEGDDILLSKCLVVANRDVGDMALFASTWDRLIAIYDRELSCFDEYPNADSSVYDRAQIAQRREEAIAGKKSLEELQARGQSYQGSYPSYSAPSYVSPGSSSNQPAPQYDNPHQKDEAWCSANTNEKTSLETAYTKDTNEVLKWKTALNNVPYTNVQGLPRAQAEALINQLTREYTQKLSTAQYKQNETKAKLDSLRVQWGAHYCDY